MPGAVGSCVSCARVDWMDGWMDGWMDYCLRVFDSTSTCPVIVLLKHSLSLILCNSGAGPKQEVTERHRKCCWSLAVVFLGRKDEGCL